PLASDSDGDGVPDNVEIAQRSDPNDPEDKPSAGGKPVILYEPFKITIQFPTEIGRQYQIYHSKDLMRWEAVTGILPGSGVVNEFNDEGAEVMGFWKVITVP
ncbi:MAG: thrombospondin type 3 repeat-containing protein, partial [Limisphaerales bacterium]